MGGHTYRYKPDALATVGRTMPPTTIARDGSTPDSTRRHALVVHPSPDLYGSDRQLLETVAGLVEAGWGVESVLPATGPLVDELRARGAGVQVIPFPVLRKAALRPTALPSLVIGLLRATLGGRRMLRRLRPDAILVNTLTEPSWLLAARLAGVPSLCHVHEAESDQPFVVRAGLALPLLLAQVVVANSRAAADVLVRAVPRLRSRVRVVHNGVPGPQDEPAPPRPRTPGDPLTIALVGRLSPRKGIDVAIDAVGLLVARGVDARLRIAGTPFAGYEWYEEQIRAAASRPDVTGRIELLGYVHPTWALLADADVVVVPSRVEPFGNTAVEAMLARRPLVASRVQGLHEIVRHNETGLLVEPADPTALSDALVHLAAEPLVAARLAGAARIEAVQRFAAARYRDEMVQALDATLVSDAARTAPAPRAHA